MASLLVLRAGEGKADLREFYWLYVGDWYELSAGLRKVFWGTTESQHLVDVVNQTDLVENPDGEDKLGQPMVGTLLLTDLGSFEFYLMPYFRKRTFPDSEGRLRSIPYIDTETALYESSNKEKHVDFAMRWAKILDNWDIGLSYFYGTNREPSLVSGDTTSENTFFIPFYNLMHQAGLDIQGVVGAWLWKLEAIRRFTDELDFTALTTGFEYTFYNVKESGMDIGLVSEYLYDNRGIMASSGFDDDLMIGMRFIPNDVQGTEILLSMIMDRSSRGRILRLEASRRLTDHLRLNLESTFFSNLSQNDSIYSFRKDDFIQLQLSYYF